MGRRSWVILSSTLLIVMLSQPTECPGWVEVDRSPVPTGRSAIGWIGDYVYVFGNEYYPDVALCWHVHTDTWGYSTPHPSGPSDNWTGTVLGGELYVLGRYNMSIPTNEFWKFTPDGSGTGTWTQLANYPMNICMLAVAANENFNIILAAGGYNGSAAVNNVYAYSVAGDNWVPYAPLPQARACVGGVVLNDKFYVVAGLDAGFSYVNTLYMFDPDSAAWFQKASLPQAVGFNWSTVTTTTFPGNYIWQVGGGGGYGGWPALNAVQWYDADLDFWFLYIPLPVAHGINSAVFYVSASGGWLLSTGGYTGSGYTGRTFKQLLFTGAEEGPEARTHPWTSLETEKQEPRLLQNQPNPCGEFTIINYQLPKPVHTVLEICDISGRLVRTLVDENQESGSYRTSWDGKTATGTDVAAGVYFYRLIAGNFTATKKMIVLK